MVQGAMREEGVTMQDTTMGPIETCSWCCTEVLDSTLRTTKEGRLCRECFREYHAEHVRGFVEGVTEWWEKG